MVWGSSCSTTWGQSYITDIGKTTVPLAECLTGALGLPMHPIEPLACMSEILCLDQRVALASFAVLGAFSIAGYCLVRSVYDVTTLPIAVCTSPLNAGKKVLSAACHLAIPCAMYYFASQYV